ncbi:MAG TPA: GNAT family N-acetyltransferase, partial [Gaiellaceae bacterium]|nr:GNAT family N-acetyltransferase [Gaiellaceae bacterium]
ATAADEATLLAFTEAIFGENWDRPWPPREVTPQMFEGKLVLVAEDEGEPVGYAFGDLGPGHAHVNIVYVVPEKRRQGAAKALLAAFGKRAREAGIEHLTLDVATGNEVGREAWRRLGFREWAQRLTVPIERLEQRDAHGESYASLHVQSDDRDAVETAVTRYLARLGGSGGRVEEPRNGWVAVYAELIDRDRRARERLASELSNATAAVVCAISVDDGVVVRYVLYERGSVVDEYQSVPEHFGPLPPGDVVALGANPTVVSRLTGAEPARVRAVARTAASPDELPPADELLQQLAEVLGLQGAGRG